MRRKIISLAGILILGLGGLWLASHYTTRPLPQSPEGQTAAVNPAALPHQHGEEVPCEHCARSEAAGMGAEAAGKAGARQRASLVAPIREFDTWLIAHVRGESPAAAEAVRLAQARRAALKELIRKDPAAALASAIPPVLRKTLPADVVAELETFVDARGSLEVVVGCGPDGSSTDRWATIGGTRYAAHVYGRRLDMLSKDSIALHGIAIDRDLALEENPYRRVSEAEAIRSDDAAQGIAVLEGDTSRTFASAEELATWARGTAEAEAVPNPTHASGDRATAAAVTADWTMGTKSLLWIRVEFSDDPGTPASDDQINASMATVNQFYKDASANRTTFAHTIVPVLFRNSQTKSFYNANPDEYTDIRDEALQAARDYDMANGNTGKYNPDRYDRFIVLFKRVTGFTISGGTGLWAGRGTLGGKGIWLNGTVGAGTTAHELGHNQGLQHSHAWKPTSTSPIQPGEHVEYGEPFDIMGLSESIPAGHFNTKHKNTLLYLPDSGVQQVTTSGTYRIQRHDHQDASGTQVLKVNLGTAYEYWIEHRRQSPRSNYTYGETLRNGVLVHWGKRPSFASGSGTYLLDHTPLSSGNMDDAPVPVGASFTDPDYGFNVTPVGTGGNAPNEWIDVLISFGATGSNRNPTVSAEAPAAKLTARADIFFSATGSDPDGDTVYYRWDFGDKRINPTTANVTHRWLSGGDYTVTCNALDGKGGIASKSFAVHVDDPLLTWTRTAEGLSSNALYGVVHAKNQFVAVGSAGTILTSPDGVSWTRLTVNSANIYTGIQSDGSQYVAVGQRYDAATQSYLGVVVRSTDGVSWSEQAVEGNPPALNGVAYGNGRWVAIGLRGQACTSSDGITWKTTPTGAANNLYGIAFADGRFFVGGTTGTMLFSADGLAWENRTVVSSALFYGVARHRNAWFASNGYETWSSADGRDWKTVPTNLDDAGAIYGLYSSDQYNVLLGCLSSERVALSEDGSYWNALATSAKPGTATMRAMAEGNGLIVAVGYSGTIFRAGTPRLLAPRIASDLRHGVTAGRPNALAVASTGYAKVQLLVNGTVVEEKSGSNPSFSWTPQSFGTYNVQIRGVSATGEAITVTQQVPAGLDRWQWVLPRKPGNFLKDVGYALGRWWAVGDFGNIHTSADGVAWTGMELPAHCELRAIAGDNERIIIASLGYESSSATYSGGLWTSIDGINFDPITIPAKPTAGFNSIVRADGRWLAAGTSGTIVSSTNGVDWTAQNSGHTSTLNAIAFGSGRWTAVGAGNVILTSTDGSNWSRITVPALSSLDSLNSVDFRDGRWIAVGASGRAIGSPDGLTWNALTITGIGTSTLDHVRAIEDRWVVSGSGGLLATSNDGVTWNLVGTTRKGEYFSVDRAAGRWCACSVAGEILTGTSLDQLAPTDNSPRAALYSVLPVADGILLGGINSDSVAARTVTPINLYKPGSGLVEAQFEGAAPGSIYAMAAAPGYYLAAGTLGRIYRSTDGLRWVSQTSGETNTLYSIALSSELAVIVGNSGRITTSPDGIAWTARTSGVGNALRAVTRGAGLFVAVGSNGTVVTSPDGIAWTPRTSGVTVALGSVVWTAATGFIAAGDSSTVIQSTDGVTWNAQRFPASTESLTGLGVTPFGVIVNNSYYNTDRGYVTSDGRNWTLIGMPTGTLYAYAHTNSIIWAVGAYGRVLSHPIGAVFAPPVFKTQPQAQTLFSGQKLTLGSKVESDQAVTYQWMKDGKAVPGATQATLEIAAVSASDAGTYTLVATNASGSTTSQTALVAVSTVDPEAAGRLSNLSIRTRAGTGEQLLIVGLTLDGTSTTATQPILIRAVGPTLSTFGVGNALADPTLSLYRGTDTIASNNDWGGDVALVTLFRRLYAFDLANAGSRDAALLNSLPKGAYTIQIAGAGGSSGIVLAEVYDATATPQPGAPRMVNVSARTTVGTGDDILIAGFTIGGRSPCKVLIRAVGPQLRAFGLAGALADPKLEVFSGTRRLFENDNWGGSAVLTAAFNATYAFALDPTGKDAALLVTLDPGAYTVQISGVGATTGIALVEVYQVP